MCTCLSSAQLDLNSLCRHDTADMQEDMTQARAGDLTQASHDCMGTCQTQLGFCMAQCRGHAELEAQLLKPEHCNILQGQPQSELMCSFCPIPRFSLQQGSHHSCDNNHNASPAAFAVMTGKCNMNWPNTTLCLKARQPLLHRYSQVCVWQPRTSGGSRPRA